MQQFTGIIKFWRNLSMRKQTQEIINSFKKNKLNEEINNPAEVL